MVVVAFSRLPVLEIKDVNGISDARKIKVSIKSLLWILTNIDDSQIELHSHTNAPNLHVIVARYAEFQTRWVVLRVHIKQAHQHSTFKSKITLVASGKRSVRHARPRLSTDVKLQNQKNPP